MVHSNAAEGEGALVGRRTTNGAMGGVISVLIMRPPYAPRGSPHILPGDEFLSTRGTITVSPKVIPWEDSPPRTLEYRQETKSITRLISANPLLSDGALAVALCALAEWQAVTGQAASGHPAALGSLLLVAIQTLPIAFRRRAPAAVLLIVAAALLGHILLGFQNSFFGTFAGVTAMYSVAAHSRRQAALLFLGLLPLALTVSLVADWRNQGRIVLGDIPYNLLLFLSAWILGDSVRTRRAYVSQLEERQRLLARERDEEAQRAVSEERSRIARELHDIVAHSVSLMVLQANAGARVLTARPEQAAEHFSTIQDAGRQALTELRRLLGVLRSDDGIEATLVPQPGIGDVAALVDQVRRSGLSVELHVAGAEVPLPQAVQLSAYRVVQEALTNALKHAGAARADVTLRYARATLEVDVRDDGHGPQNNERDGVGHGLVGLRERVGLFGGSLDTGPAPDGGFQVRATFPLDGHPS